MAKRRKKNSPEDLDMEAFLASKTFDQMSDYSQRGRKYRALSDERLVQSWQTIWDQLVLDPLNLERRNSQVDLASEFSLRGQEPPWKLVEKQIDKFLAASDRALKQLRDEHSGTEEWANKSINDDLQAFLASRRRAN